MARLVVIEKVQIAGILRRGVDVEAGKVAVPEGRLRQLCIVGSGVGKVGRHGLSHRVHLDGISDAILAVGEKDAVLANHRGTGGAEILIAIGRALLRGHGAEEMTGDDLAIGIAHRGHIRGHMAAGGGRADAGEFTAEHFLGR